MSMQINVLTLFPEMFAALDYGIPARAIKKKLLSLNLVNPRDFTQDKHRTVDDTSYGGAPGMVMKYQPLRDALKSIKSQPDWVVYLSPQGRQLSQQRLLSWSTMAQITLVCGRYEGIDERFVEQFVDEECSIGDYVLSGGELPAMSIIDAVSRLLPGSVGDQDSIENDSFYHGLLDYPHYTKPAKIDELNVPEVLLSGDHQKIADWRLYQVLKRTYERRPDLLAGRNFDDRISKMLDEIINQ